MSKKDKYGERINPRIFVGSTIVGYLFLGLALILIIQAILSVLSIYGVITVMPFATLLSGPSYIVQAFEGFLLMIAITEIAFGVVGVVCTVGILQEQEWAAGISLILMGLVALTMVLHLVINPGVFGPANLVLEIIAFAIAVLSSAYIIKHFKRFD